MRDTGMLRQAFREAMSRAGQPVKRVRGVVDSHGRIIGVYRTTSRQTVRLMTNRRRALMTVAEGFAVQDAIKFEGEQDFIGIATPLADGSAECFLVPTDEAVARLRSAYRNWLAAHPDSATDVRALRFDGDPKLAWEGFSDKWAQFRLPAATSPASMRPSLEQIIADSRRVIAAQVGRPESAVRISIDY